MIKGIAPKPEIAIKRCLKMDGVNDYLSLGNSNFYNIGEGEVTYSFNLLILELKSNNSIFRTADIGGYTSRFVINISNQNVRVGVNDGVDGTQIMIYENVIPIGEWFNLTFVRRGNNTDSSIQPGWSTSIRNPDNYQLYINGILKVMDSSTDIDPMGLPADLDNPYDKILGGRTDLSTYNLLGYYSLFSIWNRALVDDEIQNINNGIIDDYMSKGIFLFDGNTLDSSSVQGTMTLINSATPPHITYPYKDGVIPFLKSTSNQIKEFKYPENVIITKIWKERSTYNGFQYSFDNSTWLSIPNGELVDVYIVVPANTILYIKDPTSRSNYNVLHLDFE